MLTTRLERPEQPAQNAQCRRARPLLGTLVEIRARGPAAAQAVQAAFAEVGRIHGLMNRHAAGSDIGRFNQVAPGEALAVDAHTLAVLAAAARLQAESDGAFDCVFDGAFDHAPAAARGPAWAVEGAMLRKLRAARLDLGGIAKGYAVDCAVRTLLGFEIDDVLVNAGGDMRHAGRAPAAVALREPGAPARVALRWHLDNAALAGSSAGGLGLATAPRIADRRTPSAPPSVLPAGAGASVLAPSCMLADALTKVVLVCGAPDHPLLARYGARTLLYRDGRGGNTGN
ncbi:MULTISPECIES: FAD:protein FMN transferase [Cupriavidus]